MLPLSCEFPLWYAGNDRTSVALSLPRKMRFSRRISESEAMRTLTSPVRPTDRCADRKKRLRSGKGSGWSGSFMAHYKERSADDSFPWLFPNPVILSPSAGRRISRAGVNLEWSREAFPPILSVCGGRATKAAFKHEISREVLRPKEELRMTISSGVSCVHPSQGNETLGPTTFPCAAISLFQNGPGRRSLIHNRLGLWRRRRWQQ